MSERMSYFLAGLATAVAPQVGYYDNYSTSKAEAPNVEIVSTEGGATKDIYDRASLTNDTDNVLFLFRMHGDHYAFQKANEAQVEQVTENNVIEIEQIVEQAKAILGLNNVQLAKIVGVSRPSLYNHISGKEQPKTMDGYLKLFALLSKVNQEVSGDISSGIKSVLVDGKTLLNRLKSADFDENDFVSAAQIVAERMEAKSGSTKISNSRQKSVTRSLGNMG